MSVETKIKEILIAHNMYQQYGGEDAVVASEVSMLKKKGHLVTIYTKDNKTITEENKINLFFNTVWSNKTKKELIEMFSLSKPDVIHVHNTLPLISPSIFWVASKFDIPIVQTIHNFRLSCLQAMFLRENEICEECVSRIPWRGIIHKCYKDSFSASTALAITLSVHRLLGTYKNKVTAYIALNEFCKSKLVEMGLPERRIYVKPNFVLQNCNQVKNKMGNPLYVGRLSKEKGMAVLAGAIRAIPEQQFDIIGDGPERHLFEQINNVNLLGALSQNDTIDLMSNAPFIMLPSLWYENMPRTIVEAFSNGVPVIASDIGALSTMIDHGETGLLFTPGSSKALENTIKWALNNKENIYYMGSRAKKEFMSNYTEERNYKMLIDIYTEALNSC
jgi:glycosyltransferase involved in cell wall biosynthesis